MSQDEQYLNTLSIFHYILGGLTALFSCMFLFHVGFGFVILFGGLDGHNPPPKWLGLLFILLPGLAILAAWTLAGLMVAAGRNLRRRAAWKFCVVVAGLECLIMPLGTILGVLTLILLMKEPVKELFANQPVLPRPTA